MLLSMTSYGRATQTFDRKNIVVELKTLNSKYLDLRMKAPSNLLERELQVRKMISERIVRGKIEATISFETTSGSEYYHINRALFIQYWQEVKSVCEETGLAVKDVVGSLLRLPEVVSTADGVMSDEEWSVLKQTVEHALQALIDHRKIEGNATAADLNNRLENVLNLLEKTKIYENERSELVRERLRNNLKEHELKDKLDENRFEQEVFYYLDKMDINEEKVRLEQHCNYFKEVLSNQDIVKGRKLAFIAQEMGREINTLGAKAYSAKIQKLVVEMKDELEKIKEQVSNVL